MSINYKKELETAAKNMILVHDPDVLIKIIIRTVVNKLRVSHAVIFLYDKEKNCYISTVSRGAFGQKIPGGFVRLDKDNPLVYLFSGRNYKNFIKSDALVNSEIKEILEKNETEPILKGILQKILYQFEIYDGVVGIPCYFQDELLAIIMLGEKQNGQPFQSSDIDFFVALASDVAMALRNAQLFKELKDELEKEHKLFIQTSIALAAAIDAKDHYTHNHILRVANLSMEIAGRLAEQNKKIFDDKFIEDLKIGSLLHDVGKIGVPEAILNKETPLTEEERKKIEEHPLIGVMILEPIQELRGSAIGVKYHHERYDGQGYPEGLRGDEIPLLAAIISVADAFDAMTTNRPYRGGLSKDHAIAEIKRLSGKQFHPRIASVLIELYDEGKI